MTSDNLNLLTEKYRTRVADVYLVLFSISTPVVGSCFYDISTPLRGRSGKGGKNKKSGG